MQGFPLWIRLTHYVNFLFLTLIIRAGLQILADHPRLYWNVHSTPGTDWLRFTRVRVPPRDDYTAVDDARPLSPWVGIPGGRHTVGLARYWHFVSALCWVLVGLVYVALLLFTGQWRRLVPTTWSVFPDALQAAGRYLRLNFASDVSGFVRYNGLQQLAYFAIVFILSPLAILTGAAMSPALTARYRVVARLFGNRQAARSLHFIVLCSYLAFVVVHVALVALTGFTRNMNYIVRGSDDARATGIWIGTVGVAVVVGVNVFANAITRRRPRTVQHMAGAILRPLTRWAQNRLIPRVEYDRKDISPYLWVNGKMPTTEEWHGLVAGGFAGYRLRVHGLVTQPLMLSLADLRAMGVRTQITKNDCIQGWSGIAAWSGVPLREVIARAGPLPEARYLLFTSYGEGIEGGRYYDSQTINDARHPQSMLAYAMNDAPLPHAHGAPLRLRVENQLGFKQVKWIESIEFVAAVGPIYRGEGGYNEDHEYYDPQAPI